MLPHEDGQPWETAAQMDEAGDMSDFYENCQGHEHDRNSGGHVHGSQGLGRPRGHDDIHVEPDQLGSDGAKLIAPGRMAMLNLMSWTVLPLRAVSVIRMDDRSPRCYLPSVRLLRGLAFAQPQR
jgi:hypothetical protein